jgi:D-glycero-D-manno-heptose 1,7-bisphosphate phosphatase
MKTKAVFLDRDGVLIKDKSYISKQEDVEFYEDTIESLNRLQNAGYKLIIITNQSGIGRGNYREEDYLLVRKAIHKHFFKNKINISDEYYCPHSPEENCD